MAFPIILASRFYNSLYYRTGSDLCRITLRSLLAKILIRFISAKFGTIMQMHVEPLNFIAFKMSCIISRNDRRPPFIKRKITTYHIGIYSMMVTPGAGLMNLLCLPIVYATKLQRYKTDFKTLLQNSKY